MDNLKLLFVDDEAAYREAFLRSMQNEALEIEAAGDGDEALQKLTYFHPDIVLTDIKMPRMDGLQLLREIKEKFPEIFVVVVSGLGTIEDAVNAMKAGAYDYIIKPFDLSAIHRILETIREHKHILAQNNNPDIDRRKSPRFENIVGQDPQLFKLFQMIRDVAQTDATVLITGESGTGKELIAEAIHYAGPRKQMPLIKVNCTAFTETLINSELFGHEKGAFTGATSKKMGHFEIANEGSIFLDEIGDISVSTQLALLRVLESGTFQRVGGTRTIKINTRVICATNKDLQQAVSDKSFRDDLYYRINVVSLHIPPLRERKSDIPLLADHFLKKYCLSSKKNIPHINHKTMQQLVAYDWPGNIRELANCIENLVIFCKNKEIQPEDLPEKLFNGTVPSSPFTLELHSKLLYDTEATLIRRVLEDTDWNIMIAAQELGIARGTLYGKMEKYGIHKRE